MYLDQAKSKKPALVRKNKYKTCFLKGITENEPILLHFDPIERGNRQAVKIEFQTNIA
jgi:hypothetical protein